MDASSAPERSDCAWCGAAIKRGQECHDGTDTICVDCMRTDCDAKAWDSERRVIWHELAAPFNAALGRDIRPLLETVMRPEMTYAKTFAYLSDLKRRLDEASGLDTTIRARADAALHESRRLMREFLATQRRMK